MNGILNKLDVNSVLNYSIALAIVLGVKLISPIIARIIIGIFHKLFKIEKKSHESGFYGPLKFEIALIGFGIAIHFLELAEGIVNLYYKIFRILTIIAISKAIANCLSTDSTFFSKLGKATKFNGNEALNAFISKLLKVLVYTTGAFIVLSELGYDLGGLAAGLGIGSAALALAAQDFVKSIIGGISIITDKTFEIGDFIEVGTFQGTVIDLTFRSTKVKDLSNAIIAIPNSVIVTEYVKNWSKLENRRLEMKLRLDLNSSTETINRCMSNITTMLKTDKDVIDKTVSVRLSNIENDANIILIVAYINTAAYDEFMLIKERINCNILEILEKEKITYNFAEDLQVYTIKNINTLEVVKGNKCHYKPNCVKYFGNNYNCI